jgi:hypothetical protein
MSLRFDGRSGLIVVPTKIHGVNGDTVVRLALDTGATMTMVNWDVLIMLGYDPAASPVRTQVTTGSGVEFVPRIELLKLEALGETRERSSTLCHTIPPSATVDGVLGLDFFRGRRLDIDFRSGFVRVD